MCVPIALATSIFRYQINHVKSIPKQWNKTHAVKSNLPLCNARLFEDGLSFHITITYRRNTFLNSVHVSVATIGPCSRRVCVFQTFLSLLPFFNGFSFSEYLFPKKRLSIWSLYEPIWVNIYRKFKKTWECWYYRPERHCRMYTLTRCSGPKYWYSLQQISPPINVPPVAYGQNIGSLIGLTVQSHVVTLSKIRSLIEIRDQNVIVYGISKFSGRSHCG